MKKKKGEETGREKRKDEERDRRGNITNRKSEHRKKE